MTQNVGTLKVGVLKDLVHVHLQTRVEIDHDLSTRIHSASPQNIMSQQQSFDHLVGMYNQTALQLQKNQMAEQPHLTDEPGPPPPSTAPMRVGDVMYVHPKSLYAGADVRGMSFLTSCVQEPK